MIKDRVLTRFSIALTTGALAGLTFAATATARPDDDTVARQPGLVVCPLERIADQFVRCDNLTGAGVPAPSFVPEQQ